MPAIDLHSHSTRSDGMMQPAELVQRAAERGVEALALTDHDDVSGLAEASSAAEAARIRLIPGVEVSVSWRRHTLHVVGLMIDAADARLAEGLRRNRSGRKGRAERIATELENVGIRGALEGARKFASNPDLVSRTHFARYIVEAGHARTTQGVFDRYLTKGKPGYVGHEWASLEEAVSWIAGAGGIAVLAHPGRYKLDRGESELILGCFKDVGGLGVEVLTSSHTADDACLWGRLASRYGLLASGGSDFHGPGESYRDLGELPPLPAGCTPIWQEF